MRNIDKTTIRIDTSLKTKIKLLAIDNHMSFNKFINYLICLGFTKYMDMYSDGVITNVKI